MDKKVIIGIGAAGAVVIAGITFAITKISSDRRCAAENGLTLKEYREIRKASRKAEKARLKSADPENATVVA